jgi:hypothetical protein
MDNWTKLCSSILDSSVWFLSKEAKLVWITFLAKKDKVGFVRGSAMSVARDAGVTEEEAEEAIRIFLSPDPKSKTKANEGRRIEEVPGGWVVLNHYLYRDEAEVDAVREYWRKKKAEARKQRVALPKQTPLAGENQFLKMSPEQQAIEPGNKILLPDASEGK